MGNQLDEYPTLIYVESHWSGMEISHMKYECKFAELAWTGWM